MYYNTEKSVFIIMDNPFNIKVKPYIILRVYSYKKGFL